MFACRDAFYTSVVQDARPLLHVLLGARGHWGVLVAVRLRGGSHTPTTAACQAVLCTWSPDGGVLHISYRPSLLSVALSVSVSFSVAVPFPLSLPVSLPFSFPISLTVPLTFPLSLSVPFALSIPLSVPFTIPFSLTL